MFVLTACAMLNGVAAAQTSAQPGLPGGSESRSAASPIAGTPTALAAETAETAQLPDLSAALTSTLPTAPSALNDSSAAEASESPQPTASVSLPTDPLVAEGLQEPKDATRPKHPSDVDANGNPIPLDRQQPHRILGFMPNFRSVSGGAVPHPPGFKYNFTVATHQAFDYSSFIFLFLTTISAEGLNEHPVLGKGVSGFYGYGWRGFVDKTDGTYLSAWLLPSILHEDTRYYARGNEHSITNRVLYLLSRQVVTRTYSGHDTPNIAGLGGKVLTQIVSRTYYPTGATSFGVLAEKFGYSVMRDVGFTSIREFYPDAAAHYVKKRHAKAAAQAAADATAAQSQSSPAPRPTTPTT